MLCVYFALVITSPTILPTFVLPVNSSSSSSPPSSSLWSSLPSCLTGGEVYSLATEFDSGHWQMSCLWNDSSSSLFCSFLSKSYLCCTSLVLLVVPAFWLLCNEFHTGRPLYTPGVVSHFVLLPSTPSVTVLLGAVCCCMSSQLIDAKNLFDCGIFLMFFVMSLVCFKPDKPEAQNET